MYFICETEYQIIIRECIYSLSNIITGCLENNKINLITYLNGYIINVLDFG